MKSSKQMSHLCLLGFEVLRIVRIGFAANRDLLDHLDSVTLKTDDLLRVVREESKLSHAEIEENLRAEAVITQVGGKPEPGIGFNRIEPFFLQFVSVDFRGQPDPAPFLPHIKK